MPIRTIGRRAFAGLLRDQKGLSCWTIDTKVRVGRKVKENKEREK